MKKIIFSSLLSSVLLHAIPESQHGTRAYSAVKSYWKTVSKHSFTGQKGIRIQGYSFSKSSKAPALVIVPGRTEAALNYAELAFDLRKSPYSVYLLDHRGQGLSGRIVPDIEMGHVDDFYDYVNDLNHFIETVVNPKYNKEVFVFAHSMGANVATLLLEQRPHLAKALVLTSPMFKINTGNVPLFAGKLLSYFAKVVGNAAGYALGKTSWTSEESVFEGNVISNSESRFGSVMKEYENNPKIRIAGPSYGWVLEAFRSCRFIKKIKSFKTPTLILYSGQDTVVKNEAAVDFCHSKALKCEQYIYRGAKHNLALEADPVRNSVIQTSLQFFKDHL